VLLFWCKFHVDSLLRSEDNEKEKENLENQTFTSKNHNFVHE